MQMDNPDRESSVKLEEKQRLPAESSLNKAKGWYTTAYDLRYLLLLVFIDLMVHLVEVSVPFITNSFFAQKYGGGDCEADPKSSPCEKGALDAGSFKGVAHAISNVGAVVMSVLTASYSDTVGRLPLVRASAVLTSIPLVALIANHFWNLSLWVYLISSIVVTAFDVNGVYLALITDCVVEPERRAQALGIFIAITLAMVAATLPLGFVLPRDVVMIICPIALTARLIYLTFVMPESSMVVKHESTPVDLKQGICEPGKLAFQLVTRNSFLMRMTSMLVIFGLGTAGYAVVMTPFLTGYLGCDRKDFLKIGMVAILSVFLGFACLLGPLVKVFGEVRVLHLSLTASAVLPLAIAACTEKWHMLIVAAFTALMALSIPVVSAIKSNLVHKDEQGLVQGTITSISKGSAVLSFLGFGLLLRLGSNLDTSGTLGQQGKAALLPSLIAIAAFKAIALVVALTLPLNIPMPHNDEDVGAREGAVEMAYTGLAE